MHHGEIVKSNVEYLISFKKDVNKGNIKKSSRYSEAADLHKRIIDNTKLARYYVNSSSRLDDTCKVQCHHLLTAIEMLAQRDLSNTRADFYDRFLITTKRKEDTQNRRTNALASLDGDRLMTEQILDILKNDRKNIGAIKGWLQQNNDKRLEPLNLEEAKEIKEIAQATFRLKQAYDASNQKWQEFYLSSILRTQPASMEPTWRPILDAIGGVKQGPTEKEASEWASRRKVIRTILKEGPGENTIKSMFMQAEGLKKVTEELSEKIRTKLEERPAEIMLELARGLEKHNNHLSKRTGEFRGELKIKLQGQADALGVEIQAVKDYSKQIGQSNLILKLRLRDWLETPVSGVQSDPADPKKTPEGYLADTHNTLKNENVTSLNLWKEHQRLYKHRENLSKGVLEPGLENIKGAVLQKLDDAYWCYHQCEKDELKQLFGDAYRKRIQEAWHKADGCLKKEEKTSQEVLENIRALAAYDQDLFEKLGRCFREELKPKLENIIIAISPKIHEADKYDRNCQHYELEQVFKDGYLNQVRDAWSKANECLNGEKTSQEVLENIQDLTAYDQDLFKKLGSCQEPLKARLESEMKEYNKLVDEEDRRFFTGDASNELDSFMLVQGVEPPPFDACPKFNAYSEGFTTLFVETCKFVKQNIEKAEGFLLEGNVTYQGLWKNLEDLRWSIASLPEIVEYEKLGRLFMRNLAGIEPLSKDDAAKIAKQCFLCFTFELGSKMRKWVHQRWLLGVNDGMSDLGSYQAYFGEMYMQAKGDDTEEVFHLLETAKRMMNMFIDPLDDPQFQRETRAREFRQKAFELGRLAASEEVQPSWVQELSTPKLTLKPLSLTPEPDSDFELPPIPDCFPPDVPIGTLIETLLPLLPKNPT